MEPFPYVDAQRFMTVLIHDTESNEDGGRATGFRDALQSVGYEVQR